MTPAMDSTGIAATELSFRYPDYPGLPARPLLAGLVLRVPPGEIAVLLGASDEGKTTLARLLCGLVPRFSGGDVGGMVRVAGADPLRTAPYDLLESVGLVFQHPDEQITSTRCDAEVAFALESLGMDPVEIRRRVSASLDLLGLTGFEERNPATLSGGEKKRLLLACLEALDPRVWILDEAFEELDPSWRRSVLERLRARHRTTLVLDSRWSPLFARAVDRFQVLRRGAVSATATRADDPGLLAAMDEAGIAAPGVLRPSASPTVARPFLRARELSYAFPGDGAFALRVDDLELERGTVTALVGPNGSGKSTLARLLCGLVVPARGSIEMDRGAGFEPATPVVLNRHVGYLFQDPDRQIFAPTVGDELASSLRAAASSGRRRRGGNRQAVPSGIAGDRIVEAIARFDLPPVATPSALMSYGSRKRLQAACAWLLQRDVVILDEADAGLSYRAFLGMLDALRESGAGLVVVTHDAALARAVADRVIAMDGGRIAVDARAADADSALEAALAAGGLGDPGGTP
jgi:energy-coupling factor transporter ATP-binding protein EcfA2